MKGFLVLWMEKTLSLWQPISDHVYLFLGNWWTFHSFILFRFGFVFITFQLIWSPRYRSFWKIKTLTKWKFFKERYNGPFLVSYVNFFMFYKSLSHSSIMFNFHQSKIKSLSVKITGFHSIWYDLFSVMSRPDKEGRVQFIIGPRCLLSTSF